MGNDLMRHVGTLTEVQTSKTVGVFHSYPVGICNPAFTGMFLWELDSNHHLNDYKISEYHSIKSGVIMYGTEAYIFTQISNNDINSYIKILLRGRKFRNTITLSNAVKLILNYIRVNAHRSIIPSMEDIQRNLTFLIGISEESYSDDINTYMTLTFRIYLLMFMLHYKMPIQRKIALEIEIYLILSTALKKGAGLRICHQKNRNC